MNIIVDGDNDGAVILNLPDDPKYIGRRYIIADTRQALRYPFGKATAANSTTIRSSDILHGKLSADVVDIAVNEVHNLHIQNGIAEFLAIPQVVEGSRGSITEWYKNPTSVATLGKVRCMWILTYICADNFALSK